MEILQSYRPDREDYARQTASEKMNNMQGGERADPEQARQNAEKQEQAKNQILSRILEQDALVRLSNLAAAKPDKAKQVEATIIQMAQRGQIAGRMSDDGLKNLLERVSGQTASRAPTVKFDRRRAALDSDDDDY